MKRTVPTSGAKQAHPVVARERNDQVQSEEVGDSAVSTAHHGLTFYPGHPMEADHQVRRKNMI